jgi:hypothetical protein
VRAAAALWVLVAGCAQIAGLQDPKSPDGGGNGCTNAVCDLADNCGCDASTTCSWMSNTGDNYCRSNFGAATQGDGCGSDSDCVQGTSCVFGECRKYCTGDGQCGSTTCRADWTGFYPGLTCGDQCTPVTNAGCPSTLSCLIVEGHDATFCLSGDNVPLGTDCSSAPFSCVAGAICHAENGAYLCRAQCDPAGAACAAGMCTTAPDLMVGSTQYGVCI